VAEPAHRRRVVFMRRLRPRRLTVVVLLCVAALLALVLALTRFAPHGSRALQPAVQPSAANLRASGGSSATAPRPDEPRLSIAQLAGQRIIYAYSGLNPPASLIAAIRAGQAAGVILFGPNVSSSGQIRAVVRELQRDSASSPVHAPLLILADQEGGEVRRLPGAPVLSERQIGEAANAPLLAREAGTGAGRDLAAAGINVNLAPVLDVFRQPGNFIDQFQRSYSNNPQRVAELGSAFIAAQQRLGVAATAKHFPGLGAATKDQNTDQGPVTLDLSLRQLRAVDEAPYRGAIAAGVKLVMTSWAVYPALDPRLPAGLSPTVIQRELRGRLRYQGVTITDTISAGALSRFGSLAHRAVLAAQAGADLIICAATNPDDNTPAQGLAVLSGIALALAHGQLSQAAAQQAAARVLALRLHP